MRKKVPLLLVLILVALAVLQWVRGRPGEGSGPPSSEIVHPAAVPQGTSGNGLSKTVISRPVPKKSGEDPESTPPAWVSFSVQEGLAITQGDIILGVPDDPETLSGKYILPTVQYWDHPEIPYLIDAEVPEPGRVVAALKHIEEKTGFQFVPYDHQPDAVLFRNGEKNCLSTLGRQGGVQPIRLDPQCSWLEVSHEVLHAMGFIHEHSRADRDQFVEIVWGNIPPEFRDQFDILPATFMGPANNSPFDYESIMLYDTTAFSKSGQTTIKSKSNRRVAPSLKGLSAGDIARVRAFYF